MKTAILVLYLVVCLVEFSHTHESGETPVESEVESSTDSTESTEQNNNEESTEVPSETKATENPIKQQTDSSTGPTADGGTTKMSCKNRTSTRRRPLLDPLSLQKPSMVPDSIFNVLLTPTELIKYVTDKDLSKRTSSTLLTLCKPETSGILRVLRIPLMPPYFITPEQKYHIEVKVGLTEPGTSDADILFLLSDNEHAIGMVIEDPEANNRNPCYGMEGDDDFPGGITRHISRLRNIGRESDSQRKTLPVFDSLPVSEATFLLKPRQKWGACVLSDRGGDINPFGYNREIDAQRGLFLDVYLDNEQETHHIRYIGIKIFLNNN